ncbi:cupredoxin domain-containing protein [Arthrobacter bambusae]|uniref:cupredoxin domain-containing protein n=1 Tax=Arthrobacter bambusae TaxID=1338426 RepID=UPI00277D85B5|nr:cupredoxin domain-containing protein [Arthrobacter bambusae]MDQ0029571.1 plastocyanin [Arthrobacter bambusae]MDQ0097231.1 plastocyanin [Arthrobacter bambusae]
MRLNPKAMMVVLATAALIALTGCGASGTGGQATASSPASSSAAPPGTSQQLTITIKDFGYQGPASVSPGAKITVKNDDAQAHTVTSDDGKAFDAAVDGGGGTAQFTAPTTPGSYSYHCAYHSNMHGMLVVK